MDKLRFFSIGSGSSGNCYYIGTAQYGFLIDAGIGIRTIKRELKNHAIPLEHIWGIFITHDHTDHIKAVAALGERHNLPVYLTPLMQRGIERNYHVHQRLTTCCRHFTIGDTITIRHFTITPFPVSHDATDSVGYTFTYGDQRFVIATDLGYIGDEAARHITQANYLVIEANYDAAMLRDGSYPPPLKQRVASPTGHLCNDYTAHFLATHPHPHLTHIFLCHLSQDNNTPDLAYRTIHTALTTHGITVDHLSPLPRTIPSPLYTFRPYHPL